MNRRISRGAALLLTAAALAALPALAHPSEYSPPISLEGYIARPEAPDADAPVTGMGAQDAMDVVAIAPQPVSPQAQYAYTSVTYGLDGAISREDVLLSSPFSLHIREEAVYLDTADPSAPHITELARDGIAAPYTTVFTCDSRDLARWDWVDRTTGAGGMIDPESGALLGLHADAAMEAALLIVYCDPVERYRVAYHAEDGTPIGGIDALWGSNLQALPEGLALPIAEGMRFDRLVVHGTDRDAPAAADGPIALQLALVPAEEAFVAGARRASPLALDEETVPVAFQLGKRYVRASGDVETGLHALSTGTAECYSDIWYLPVSEVPPFAPADAFGNRLPLLQEASEWEWYTEADGNTVSEATKALWVLDGFALGTEEVAYLLYQRVATWYEVAFLDEDDAPLGSLEALEGGSIASVQTLEAALQLVPEAKRDAFVGWAVSGEGEAVDCPDEIRAPITLKARYLREHEVSFFLEDPDDYPLHLQMVQAGSAVDWTKLDWTYIHSLIPIEKAFAEWQLFDGRTGTLTPFAADTPITAPVKLIARLEDRMNVVFLSSGSDKWHAVRWLASGEALDVTDIPSPAADGLVFSHWEETTTGARADGLVVDRDIVLAPVFLATVTFLHGEAVYATRSVRVGTLLADLPEAPAMPGYQFDGWGVDFSAEAIQGALVVKAAFSLIPTEKPVTVAPTWTASPTARPTATPTAAATSRAASNTSSRAAATARPTPSPWATVTPKPYQGFPSLESLLPSPPTPPNLGEARQHGRFDLPAEDIPYNGVGGRTSSECAE